MNYDVRPIGVMDSGVGGISVLRELVRLMPNEDFIYYGDSQNAPYGIKTAEEVKRLTEQAVEFLIERQAKAIVVACNTATSVSIKYLREKYPDMPIIGIEPALKPAVKNKEHSRVLVMATPMTLREKKFDLLMHTYEADADIIKVPCPELVEMIESGILNGEILGTYLKDKLNTYILQGIDAIVLGCTHFPLVKNHIREIVPDNILLYDGGYGTAKETKRRLQEKNSCNEDGRVGCVRFYNSKETKDMIDLSKALLKLPGQEDER